MLSLTGRRVVGLRANSLLIGEVPGGARRTPEHERRESSRPPGASDGGLSELRSKGMPVARCESSPHYLSVSGIATCEKRVAFSGFMAMYRVVRPARLSAVVS